MRPLDFILIIPLLYAAYRGYKKGFLIEVVNILAFLVAVIGGLKFLDWGVQSLEPIIGKHNNYIPFIAFVSLFFIIIIGVSFLGKKLKNILDVTILGTVDSAIGGLVGMFKVAFALSLIMWIMDEANVNLPIRYTQGSILYPLVLDYSPVVIDWISSLLPFAKNLVQSIKELFS